MVSRIPAQVRLVALPWYRRADYPRILQIMADADQLPVTYDKWLGRAEQMERHLARQGHATMRVNIDPDQFVAWCAASGQNIDNRARSLFASEAAAAHRGN